MAQSRVQAYYNNSEVVGHYQRASTLYPVETLLLSRLRDEIKDSPILDVGVGGRRTTPHLLQISRSYVGIDFSVEMITAARQKFPGVDLRVCDARDMSMFQDGQFAAVFFLGGGIDDVSPADRLRILKEICRVLGGGTFIMPGHNFAVHTLRYLQCGLRLSRHPAVLFQDNLLRLKAYVSHCGNRLWSTLSGKGYAVYLDYDECFSDAPIPGVVLPTYYMRRQAQVKQLLEFGFSQVQAVDQKGTVLDDDREAKDQFLHYVARKHTRL
ncbi:MAG: class I SAM-dependent methyltransferase [Acidobacteriia bacterium]|nr:class I SAM-dependent methyltransferase [Terriglobia bacterium]